MIMKICQKQKVFFEMKSNENEINYLKHNLDKYRLEVELQQIEYSAHLKSLAEENDSLRLQLNEQDQQAHDEKMRKKVASVPEIYSSDDDVMFTQSKAEPAHLQTPKHQQSPAQLRRAQHEYFTVASSSTIPSPENVTKLYLIEPEENKTGSANFDPKFVNRASSPISLVKYLIKIICF